MIERRELLIAGAGLAVGAAARPAAAQRHAMVGMAMPMSMTECIDDCIASHRMCLQTAAYASRKGGALATAPLLAMLGDCAELCQATANSMLRESPLHKILCGACAEACERCAQECLRHAGDSQMARCSATCRDCAASCREMAAMDG